MLDVYERDLDLNLLRVFVVVARSGSVTAAAGALYLTQPAVSAALARLATALGHPLFVRRGRGLALTTRGERLLAAVEPHLRAMVEAARDAPTFDPRTEARPARLGLSDAMERWLLPRLLDDLRAQAPELPLIVRPVQFRTVAEALASGDVECAVTVADALPRDVRRERLFGSGFVCLFDPAHARIGRRVDEATYFAHAHVIVTYAGDLRGIVEDVVGRRRRVRCAVPSFASVGALVEGTDLLATLPARVADSVLAERPRLRALPLPFALGEGSVELLWPATLDDDPRCAFVRAAVRRAAAGS